MLFGIFYAIACSYVRFSYAKTKACGQVRLGMYAKVWFMVLLRMMVV